MNTPIADTLYLFIAVIAAVAVLLLIVNAIVSRAGRRPESITPVAAPAAAPVPVAAAPLPVTIESVPAAPAAILETAPLPAAPAPALSAAARGSAGEVKLYNVPPARAAMLMAIVASKLEAPLNELRFVSIREVEE